MEVHGFTDAAETAISATIDGVWMSVPNDPANRHRQMIAEWEAAGNTIPPYVPPEIPRHEKSAEERLAEFLAENPDVLELINK